MNVHFKFKFALYIMYSSYLLYIAIPITIGLRQRLYYVDENSDRVVVCYDVLSGRTASRSFNMQLRTVQGDAICTYTEL